MSMSIRVSLPGYNALTDGTVDHFSIYADSNNVLIKEERRGTTSIANAGSAVINHSLGYIPFYLVYSSIGGGTYRVSNAFNPLGNGWKAWTDTSNLKILNDTGSTGTTRYYIFYDNVGSAI